MKNMNIQKSTPGKVNMRTVTKCFSTENMLNHFIVRVTQDWDENSQTGHFRFCIEIQNGDLLYVGGSTTAINKGITEDTAEEVFQNFIEYINPIQTISY